VLVLLIGIGAGACGGRVEEEAAPTPAPTLPTPPTPTPEAEEEAAPPEETPQPVTGSDGRLRVVVDNIERHNRVYPERIVGSYGVRPLKPGEGVDQIVIYLTIAPIQDLCVAGLAMNWFLADTDGNECTMHEILFDGFVATELGSSCGEEDFWEEITAKVSFPFPEYAMPAKLKVGYPFLEPGEGGSIQRGQIDTILP